MNAPKNRHRLVYKREREDNMDKQTTLALAPSSGTCGKFERAPHDASVPILVARREPKWLTVNRIIGQRMRFFSQRLASISSRNQVESQEENQSLKAGDQAVVHIPAGDMIAQRLKDVPVYTVTSNDNFVLLQVNELK